MKALVAATERRTAQVNAYADSLALECGRKEKEASELRGQVAALKEELESNYGINICESDN